MDQMFLAGLVSANDATRRHLRSALPDAPVVPDRPRGQWRKGYQARSVAARSTAARGLERLARTVAPAPARPSPSAAACTPASCR